MHKPLGLHSITTYECNYKSKQHQFQYVGCYCLQYNIKYLLPCPLQLDKITQVIELPIITCNDTRGIKYTIYKTKSKCTNKATNKIAFVMVHT